MSAKTFLIAHGEKLAVAAVAGGCALVLMGTIDDPSIKPKDNKEAIETINAKIDKVFKAQSPPVMKEPRAYLDQMLGRVGDSAPASPTMAWLTSPPDKGRGTPDDEKGKPPKPTGTYLYVYELLTPTVAIEDAIGSLKISVASPESTNAAAARRVTSDANRTWTREDRGTVTNTGRHLGVQVQIKVGDNDWKALVLPGAAKDGVLPMAKLANAPVTIPTPEPWQRHQLRARIIAAATALDIDGKVVERPKQSVVVHPGQASAGPTEDQALLDKALAQYASKDGALFKTLLRPSPGPLPAGSILAPGEKLFLGPWSPIAKVDATASVRFALVGLSTAPLAEDPTKSRDVGRFLLLRLFQQGEERKWMDKPLEEKFGVGDVLGKKDEKIENPFIPGKKISVDLMTPFVVDKLIKDQKRVLYWTVKTKGRDGGGKDRHLDLGNKEVPTDVVVLKNPETGSELTLTKLISISPPNKADTQVYPYHANQYVERDEFTSAPSEFRQWGLEPEKPKAWNPGAGPLADLYKAKQDEGALDAESYTTDTDYYAFPDGRVVWWDLVEHKLMIHDPDGVLAAKPAEAAPKTPEAQPTAGKPTPPPTGKPPGSGAPPGPGAMPPGAMPPGAMPPGFTPPTAPPRK